MYIVFISCLTPLESANGYILLMTVASQVLGFTKSLIFAKHRPSFLWNLILGYNNVEQFLWQLILGYYDVEQSLENSIGPVHDLS